MSKTLNELLSSDIDDMILKDDEMLIIRGGQNAQVQSCGVGCGYGCGGGCTGCASDEQSDLKQV